MRNSRRLAFLSVLAAAGLTSTIAQAGDWTQFRGPDGRATSDATTVPAEFGPDDYNWKIDLPGLGHGSPVVVGKKLFLTVVTSANERKVLCYNTEDGEVIWEWAEKFKAHNKHKFNEFASSTPCLDDSLVYVSWSSGAEFHALALDHDGQLQWERKLGGFEDDHGGGTSPVLVGGGLFLFWDELGKQQTTYALLNPKSGETMWEKTLKWPTDRKELKTTYSTPTLFENSKGETEILVSSMAFGVQSINPKNGEVNWSFDQKAGVRTVASPTVEDGVVFATWGSGNGAKDHIALIPGSETSSGEAEVAWKWDSNKGLPYVPTPLAHNGLLYMWNDGGILTCVRAKSGEIVFGPERVTGRFFSNPILIGDKIYCGSREDSEGGPSITVVDAGEEFNIVARNSLEAGVNATPAVADGKLFIRTDKHLISVGG